jgi:outer membrane receptor protein involved in Fe transport
MLQANRYRARARFVPLLFAIPFLFTIDAVAAEGGGIEEVVVTAQRRAETIQDVPISVSAFDTDALDRLQIDTFSDLQFNVPNVSYTKTNFTGTNFQIRGIGTLLTATGGDSGVAMHINDVYLNEPRIFETEYYDMAQVEILRGPQGTLFGRNATGGAVNLKTRRPDIGEFNGDIEAQLGNFSHKKIKGAVNIPINDTMAARFAGIYLKRDGYTKDEISGDDVDNRKQWSVRGSFRWEPTDSTTIDLMGHYFDESSERTRGQKQLCNFDPSGVLGCLPNGLSAQPLNPFATAGSLLSSNLLLGPLGLFDINDINDLDPSVGNPNDLRKIRQAYKPEYESDETFVMIEIKQGLNDWLDMNFLAGYQDTSVTSRTDYNGTAADLGSIVLPAGFCAFSPAACSFYGTSDGGPVWTSTVPKKKSSLGSIVGGNEFELSTQGGANDISWSEANQWSTELRFTSSLDGPLNFMVAGYYLDYETAGGYNVKGPVLDYPAMVLANGALAGSATDFVTLAPGFFDSTGDDPRYKLKSYGGFGELYWEASETVKLTFGLRYTKDKKDFADRQVFLNVPTVTNVPTGVSTFAGTPVSTIDELVNAAVAAGAYDADPNEPGSQAYREDKISFDEWTGRFVVDWTPDVGFTDETLLYFSYSKGYKGGALNPPIDTTLFPNTPESFEPEKINAYEVGTKNTFLDNTMQVNLAAFYYDYGDLQIGKIVNRTSLNENTDATVYGMEAEVLWAPDEHWMFNSQVSYLNTELDKTSTIDPRDPTQGRQDVTLYKDFASAQNCVLEHNGLTPPNDDPAFIGAVQGAGAPYFPTGEDLGPFGLNPGTVIPETPGVTDSAFSACAAIQGFGPAFGYGYLDSVSLDLDGNELLNAPEWTVSLGAQYTFYFDNGMSLTTRADYYWQDEFYSTTFNRPQDKFDSWDIINLQATLYGKDDKWFVRGFVQNLEDDDEVTGTYQTDPSSGLFTNMFLVEPRLYGLTLGVSM